MSQNIQAAATPATSDAASIAAQDYLVKTSQETIAIHTEFMRENAVKLVEAAQHMAAEMVGRMLVERKPLPAIALTTDSSNLTAIGNDFGYEHVVLKQVQALARQEDVLLAIST